MGRYADGTVEGGLLFRINRTFLSRVVYGWNDLTLNRHFLVYAVAISLDAGDVVKLEAAFDGTALYQEFSGYYLGSAINPTQPPTPRPTQSPTPNPTACVAPAPAPPLNIGFSVLSPASISTVVVPGSNAFSGYAAGSATIDYDNTAGLAGGWDGTNFEYVAPSTGYVRLLHSVPAYIIKRDNERPPMPTHAIVHSHINTHYATTCIHAL
jgi:hypothetical protein